MDQLLDKFTEALLRLKAVAQSFVQLVESLLDSFFRTLSLLMAGAFEQLEEVEPFLNKFSQLLPLLLADLLDFFPPVVSELYLPMLGGLAVTILVLMIALMLNRRANARASKEFGRGITFEDISAETANGAIATTADITASKAESAWPTAQNTAVSPNENAIAQTNGFTFFKRKSGSIECAVAPSTNPLSGEEGYAPNNATTPIGDDVVLAGLEQEMLATRQLYLDGTISKEVYVSETRALYQKAKLRMT